jgi:1-acyl-sn-glycerol-3-phosphate acyltransferase
VLDFRPPEDNEFIINFTKLIFPLVLKFKLHGAELKVVGDGLERFNKLKGKRTVVCPNHSYRHDPEVMFALADMADEEFNFIAAREVFDWNNGLNGWLLQQLGCYSVVRGAVDRESFKTTKNIIVQNKKKLVLFPEGEISRQNDVLLPLETGAVQLSYWALDELHKSQPDEPVFIQPVALKYTYKDDITEHLSWCMMKVERRLGIDNHGETSLYKRVRAASEVVLSTLEREYNCKPQPTDTLNERMNRVKSEALQTMAEFLGVDLPSKGSHLDWVRVLRNTMDDFIYGETDELPPYQRKIWEEKAGKVKRFYRDLDRVVAFIAIYEGYLTPPTTQERLSNVVELFESEVFGEVSVKGSRLIYIHIGEPINLLDKYADYKKNKKQVIESVTLELSQQLSGMLDTIDKTREIVFVS